LATCWTTPATFKSSSPVWTLKRSRRIAKPNNAVLRALEVIGEAAKRVPPDTQGRFPDTPWRQIIGMRNVIAHDYLGIRLSRIFETATVFIPQLLDRLPKMIAELKND
jgi:uncharacterized protein with HEPN domain